MKTLNSFLILAITALALSAAAQDSTKMTDNTAMTSSGTVTAELKVCTGVEERMPVGEAGSFPATVGTVFVWSKIMGVQGEASVKHVYKHNGIERAVVPLTVKSSSWRTWSSKQILPEWTGEWTVELQDESGTMIASTNFSITEAAMTAPSDSAGQ